MDNFAETLKTIIIAHPDDEIIFGFPVIKKVKRIICCVSDGNRDLPKCRSWHRSWMYREAALLEVGTLLGVEIINLNYNSMFHTMSKEEINKLSGTIKILIQDEEIVYTHNAWGEYGHPDHILVHDIIKKSGKKILTSDIMLDSTFTGFEKYSIPEPKKYNTIINDIDLYLKCMNIYRKYKCWTWGNDIIKTTKIYIENE